MSYPVPMVHLTLEGMRMEIVKALNVQIEEMQEIFEEEVKHVVENFDYRHEVSRIARQAISDAIERETKAFFASGGPGGKAIRDAVATKLDKDGSWNV